MHGAHRLGDVLCGLGDLHFGHNTNAFAPGRVSEVGEIALTDQRLLDQDGHLGVAALGEQFRPEDRLVGHRPLRERERPLPQPVVAAADVDGRHPEPFFDRLFGGHGVLADVRPEHRQTALVDQFAVGVDDGLDRAFGQPLHFPVHDLHRTVDDPLPQPVGEYQFERLGQVVAHLLRIELRQQEVEEVADLDRLRGALVGQVSISVSGSR